MITASDTNAKIWDVATKTLLFTLTGHTKNISNIEFSHDGTKVATSSYDQTARIWDISTGNLLSVFNNYPVEKTPSYKNPIRVKFSPDDTKIALFTKNEMFNFTSYTVWSMTTELLLYRKSQLNLTLVDFSPNNSKLAVLQGGHLKWEVKIVDTVKGTNIFNKTGKSTTYWSDVSFSHDGSKIATSSRNEAIIWNATTGETLHSFSGRWEKIAFSSDDSKIMTAGYSSAGSASSKIWNVSTGRELLSINSTYAKWSPDETKIVTRDGKIWNSLTGKLLLSLDIDGDASDVSFSPDGTNIFATVRDVVFFWDASTGLLLEPEANKLPRFAFDGKKTVKIPENQKSISGTYLATDAEGHALTYTLAGDDADSFIFDVITGKLAFKYAPDYETPDSKAGTNTYSVTIKAKDTKGGIGIQEIEVIVTNDSSESANNRPIFEGGATRSVTLSENQKAVTGTYLATDRDVGDTLTYTLEGADADKFNFDSSTGKLTFKVAPDYEFPGSADFSNTYKVTIRATDTQGSHSKVQVYATVHDHFLSLDHGASIIEAIFSPDGSKMITASSANAKIWDVATKTLLFTLTGHTKNISDIDFSHDGTKVATSSYDQTARIWDVSTGKVLSTINNYASGETPGSVATYVEFSPDDTKIAVFNSNYTLWNITTKSLLYRKTSIDSDIVTFSPDSTKLAVLYNSNNIKIVNATSGADIWEKTDVANSWNDANFSHDGSKVVAASDSKATIWNATTGETLHSFSGDWKKIAFSSDDSKIITAGNSSSKIWNVSTGKELVTINGGYAKWSPDGTKIVTRDGKIWDSLTGKILLSLNIGTASDVSFSPDGTKISTTVGDDVFLWDASTGLLLEQGANLASITAISDSTFKAISGNKKITKDVIVLTFDRDFDLTSLEEITFSGSEVEIWVNDSKIAREKISYLYRQKNEENTLIIQLDGIDIFNTNDRIKVKMIGGLVEDTDGKTNREAEKETTAITGGTAKAGGSINSDIGKNSLSYDAIEHNLQIGVSDYWTDYLF